MKTSNLAAAVAMGLALGFGQVALAQKSMDNVMKMDANKDGAFTKAEVMRMVEAKVDEMMKKKGVQKFTPAQVQEVIDDIARTYGTAQ